MRPIIKRESFERLGWFVLLYAAGVGAVTAIAYLIRMWIG